VKVLRWVTGVALVIALVGVALGVVSLVRAEPKSSVTPLRSEVASLHRQLTATNLKLAHTNSSLQTAEASLTTVQADVGNIQSSSTAGQIAGLKRTVSQMQTCVPEIQTEIGGLSVDWNISGTDANQDSFDIANPTIISTDCSKTLYGSG
jgi:hypothetical protein